MKVVRKFIPGSRWIYFKFYMSASAQDLFLSNVIFKISNSFFKKKLIYKWFFVRYSDPDSHLRVRFLLTEERFLGEVVNLVYEKIKRLMNSSIWKVQIDTYTRELERYSPLLMSECESLFYINSGCVLRLLRYFIQNETDEKYRWLIAVKLIDEFFNSFRFDNSRKLKVLSVLDGSFKREFKVLGGELLFFKNKFRENKYFIKDALAECSNDFIFRELSFIVRDCSINEVANQIFLKIKSRKGEAINFDNLVSHQLHMIMNRIFSQDNRIYELIIYDFLHMHYKSVADKEKQGLNI